MSMFRGWEKTSIVCDDGERRPGIEPIIISASRATDIPAFYGRWFANRYRAGYVCWTNPFNRKRQYVSLRGARAYVFWSKYPRPFMPELELLDADRCPYYCQFTLNDYEAEGLEAELPSLHVRLESFRELSDKIGPARVIWRADPLLLTDKMDVPALLDRLKRLGDQLHPYTEKMVISFIDIAQYVSVQKNLKWSGKQVRELTEAEMLAVAEGIQQMAAEWGLTVATCAEPIALERFGITHNKCIDDELLAQLWPDDTPLMGFLGRLPGQQLTRPLVDPGQRGPCGCIPSKDIGAYNSCPYLCTYCYASHSHPQVMGNITRHDPSSDSLLP
jgi:hypothetical protein